jgi:hypothetical protein
MAQRRLLNGEHRAQAYARADAERKKRVALDFSLALGRNRVGSNRSGSHHSNRWR